MSANRTVCICLIAASVAAAQDPPQSTSPQTPSVALEQAVKQKTTEWEMLAQGLSALIRPLLSCDPKVAAAITAVSQASDARIAAISAYFLEASRQTGLQTASARRLLASVQPLGSDLAAEKADLVREQLDVSGQIAALSESGQRRPSFNGAQDALRQISAHMP